MELYFVSTVITGGERRTVVILASCPMEAFDRAAVPMRASVGSCCKLAVYIEDRKGLSK